jgi:hypothetical protein
MIYGYAPNRPQRRSDVRMLGRRCVVIAAALASLYVADNNGTVRGYDTH